MDDEMITMMVEPTANAIDTAIVEAEMVFSGDRLTTIVEGLRRLEELAMSATEDDLA